MDPQRLSTRIIRHSLPQGMLTHIFDTIRAQIESAVSVTVMILIELLLQLDVKDLAHSSCSVHISSRPAPSSTAIKDISTAKRTLITINDKSRPNNKKEMD